MSKNSLVQFKNGFVLGLPIMLGYLPVSFTFGSVAVGGGLSPLSAFLMSLTNLTSSGQFAVTEIIAEHGAFLEVVMVTLVINIRYFLMSMALSQKLEPGTSIFKKMAFSFGVTDEVFAVASTQHGKISASFMFGLILTPILGWSVGTALGAVAMGFVGESFKNAMGIALYGMFISIIIPPARAIKPIFKVVLFSAILSAIIFYVPLFKGVGAGTSIIITAILGALFGAKLFPIREEGDD